MTGFSSLYEASRDCLICPSNSLELYWNEYNVLLTRYEQGDMVTFALLSKLDQIESLVARTDYDMALWIAEQRILFGVISINELILLYTLRIEQLSGMTQSIAIVAETQQLILDLRSVSVDL